MERIKSYFDRNATGKRTLLLFVMTNLVYLVMIFVTIPMVTKYSDGLKLLDMMPAGYDPAYVETLFNVLGEKGRFMYLFRQIPVDMVYPGLFAISYSLVMAFFLKKLGKFIGAYFYLCLLPILVGLSDYLENFGIVLLLKGYPDLSKGMMSATNICTLVKSTVTSFFFTALIVVLVFLALRRLR